MVTFVGSLLLFIEANVFQNLMTVTFFCPSYTPPPYIGTAGSKFYRIRISPIEML